MARRDIADALAEAARSINAPVSIEETLDAIVHAAANTLSGIDHVGISVAHRDGTFETKAATDQVVWRLDILQYENGEGPCVYAMRGHGVVTVEHAAQDERWPRYLPRAVEEGLRSQIGVQLYADDRTLGGLNMYSLTQDTLSADTVHDAELFGTYAALALKKARKENELTSALDTRKVIGQAIGILMERYDLDEDRAFRFLARTSQTSNTKLRDIARELVDTGNERAPDDFSLPCQG